MTKLTSSRYVEWLNRHRALVLLVALAALLPASLRTALTYASLRSEIDELLPESAPSVIALGELRQRMPGLRHLGVVIDTGGTENVSAANRFLDDLAGRIRAYPPELVASVRTDVSAERRFVETFALQLMEPSDVRRLREAVEARRDWEVTRSLDLDLDGAQTGTEPKLPLGELRAKYELRLGQSRTLASDRFVSRDGMTSVLVVQASSHATGESADRALIQRVRADASALGFPESYAPGLRMGFAGDVATRVEEMAGLKTDLGVAGVAVSLLVLGVIVAFFRSWRAIPILGAPLLTGATLAFAIAALPPLGIRHLNSNTAFLASIIAGNGINSGIILLARFREELARGFERHSAVAVAVRETWRPTLAASLAASAAYAALIVTDFRGFNQFGWIGGIGLVTTWTCTYALVPVLAPLLFRAESEGSGRFLGRRAPSKRPMSVVADLIESHPRLALATAVGLTLFAVAGVSRRGDDWLEYDLSKLRRRDSWQVGERYWGARMDATLGRYLTPSVILARDGDQARRIEERVLGLVRAGGAGNLVASVRSASTILRPDRDASLAEARALAEIVTPRMKQKLSADERRVLELALSPAALRRLEPTDLPETFTAGLRERDGRIDRSIVVFPKLAVDTWNAERIDRFTRDLRAASAENGGSAPVAGSLLLSSDIAGALRLDGPRATAVAFAIVAAITIVTFHFSGLSLAAMASLVAGVLLMLGVMAWTGQRLNFSNFVALPITFGIGADYSINVLRRWQSDGGGDLRGALSETGGAVALCSATTVIGYGSLLLAQNQALRGFGTFAIAGELACLLTAILALPATLLLSRGTRLAPAE